jgi:hypothetical protein
MEIALRVVLKSVSCQEEGGGDGKYEQITKLSRLEDFLKHKNILICIISNQADNKLASA